MYCIETFAFIVQRFASPSPYVYLLEVVIYYLWSDVSFHVIEVFSLSNFVIYFCHL